MAMNLCRRLPQNVSSTPRIMYGMAVSPLALSPLTRLPTPLANQCSGGVDRDGSCLAQRSTNGYDGSIVISSVLVQPYRWAVVAILRDLLHHAGEQLELHIHR